MNRLFLAIVSGVALAASSTAEEIATTPAVHHCTPAAAHRPLAVSFNAPADQEVTGLIVSLRYPSKGVSLPGTGADPSIAARVIDRPSDAVVAVHQRDDALRVVLSRAQPFVPGRLFTIDFDGCEGATTLTGADFACQLEGCANQFGKVDGCACSVLMQ
jgi:hypothetical protein